MSKIRVGLIGFGDWTRSAYVPALRLDGRAEVTAVAAPSAATRDRALAELGSEITVCASASELLAAADLDAVTVAVPDLAHEAVLTEALASGLPLLFEPPVASDRPGVERMVAARRAAPQLVHPDLELSYLPVVARLREALDAGAIGQPRTALVRLQAGWGHPPRHSLSVVHMLAGWYLDMLDRAIGRTARRVLVLNGDDEPGLMQTRATAHLDYGDVQGTFQVNIGAVGPLRIDLEVNGTEGDIVCDPLAGAWRLRTREFPHWRLARHPALEPPAGWPGVHECLRAFLDAVEQGTTNNEMRDAIIRQHEVGLAADRSCDSGAWEEVRPV
ncbi:MAG: Gfo/Idh/MocA family oxidoreductase [Chloroflexota bacterium]|nr:Gfo/Idh/MocA family oxidoreductase [Chloroflexota bacterium]